LLGLALLLRPVICFAKLDFVFNVVCVQPDFVFSAEGVSSSHQFLLTPSEKWLCAEASPLESKVLFFIHLHFLIRFLPLVI
jgi:hypothetical protein